jgi:hypothetical protein
MLTKIQLPRRGKGNQSAAQRVDYDRQIQVFADSILQIKSCLDFNVGTRGWCYLLEQEGAISKGDFDRAEKIITQCRKDGALPLDICVEDGARQFENLDDVDDDTPQEYAQRIVAATPECAAAYNPLSFWANQDYYCEMIVEKIDLKSLFAPICAEYHIPLANARGWPDVNMRAAMMMRFAYWESQGKTCVLLLCGDFDPAGVLISDKYRDLLSEIRAVPWSAEYLIIDRFGLNRDFIEDNDLPWIDNLITGGKKDLDDPGHGHHDHKHIQHWLSEVGARKVEANALVVRPDAGRQLCREAIEKYVDLDAKAQFEKALTKQQKQVHKILQAFVDRP